MEEILKSKRYEILDLPNNIDQVGINSDWLKILNWSEDDKVVLCSVYCPQTKSKSLEVKNIKHLSQADKKWHQEIDIKYKINKVKG